MLLGSLSTSAASLSISGAIGVEHRRLIMMYTCIKAMHSYIYICIVIYIIYMCVCIFM